jgi:uncharacterized protein with von Willebrand factor type A (vWA) domain
MRDLDWPYQRLAALPRELWLPVLINGVGATARRLADLAPWHAALVAGELAPREADFADAAALEPMREAIGALGLHALTRGTPALALQVLRTMLWHLDRIASLQPRLARDAAIARAAAAFRDEWELQKHGLDELLALLQGLGDLAHLQWDELQGRLSSREWREAQRIAALLAQLPAVAALIRALGRAQHHPERPPAASTTPPPRPHAVPLVLRETRLPDAPGELKGIRQSDRIERMLGSEALQIRHPVLHKLWRARLAESRLLTYDSEAILLERVPDARAAPRPAEMVQRERLERGPMIVCVDTSGSMRGAPEKIAKAVVLEAMRTAQREQRGCRLIAFGGPGEVVEATLEASRGGLDALLGFMGQAFDGGTDVQTPIERAVELVRRSGWSSADLLVVSDGEFGCTRATLELVAGARREQGLRVQGVLVGDRETMGLLDLCDDIFWQRDWRRFEGETPAREAFVPVHSQSLTALYFPNALGANAARLRPPS